MGNLLALVEIKREGVVVKATSPFEEREVPGSSPED